MTYLRTTNFNITFSILKLNNHDIQHCYKELTLSLNRWGYNLRKTTGKRTQHVVVQMTPHQIQAVLNEERTILQLLTSELQAVCQVLRS